MPNEMEAMMARIEAKIAEEFRKFRLHQAKTLRDSAGLLGPGPERDILLIMAKQWEEAAAA